MKNTSSKLTHEVEENFAILRLTDCNFARYLPKYEPGADSCWQCNMCKYWEPVLGWDESDTGNCYRHAPRPVIATNKKDFEILNSGAVATIWPITTFRDRCGDFVMREKMDWEDDLEAERAAEKSQTSSPT